MENSHLTHMYLLHSKSDMLQAYKTFEAWAETQLDAKIKCLHSDHGGEFTGAAFVKHLNLKGTVQKLTIHDTPKQNGVAEVLNHIAMEHTRAILHTGGLPKFLWGEALHHVIWLKIRTSTTVVPSVMPLEAVTKKKPNLSALPEWGCEVWVHTLKNSKLDVHATCACWISFDKQSKGSRIYWPKHCLITVEMSITFTPAVVIDDLEGEDDSTENLGKVN